LFASSNSLSELRKEKRWGKLSRTLKENSRVYPTVNIDY